MNKVPCEFGVLLGMRCTSPLVVPVPYLKGPLDGVGSLNHDLWASTGRFQTACVSLGQHDTVQVIIAYDEQTAVPSRYENHLVSEMLGWDSPWSGNVLILGLNSLVRSDLCLSCTLLTSPFQPALPANWFGLLCSFLARVRDQPPSVSLP